MEVTFLYFEDCPSHAEALERLQHVLTQEGMEAEIEIVKVESDEQAGHLRFTGSPTILIDRQDIDPPPAGSHYGLACRVYHLEDGRISPLPSLTMIRRAVRKAET